MSEVFNEKDSATSERLPKQDILNRVRTKLSGVAMRLLSHDSSNVNNEEVAQLEQMGAESTSLRSLDFHGDIMLIDETLGKTEKPIRHHITAYNTQTKRYEYFCLSDIQIDFMGERISYLKLLKKRGSPIVL